MIYIYLLYGASFLAMGLAVLVYPKDGTRLPFARPLRWLAAFGILHGIHEWFDLLALARGGTAFPRPVTLATLVASYFCLARFGAQLASARGAAGRAARHTPWLLAVLWLVVTVLNDRPWDVAELAARYVIGGPAAGLAAWGVVAEAAALTPRPAARFRLVVPLLAGTFAIYGLFTLVGSSGSAELGASLVDERTFLSVAGVPIQLLRALSALVMTALVVYMLGVFRWEARSRLQAAHDALEDKVELRTAELRAVNERLQDEVALRAAAEQEVRRSERFLSAIVGSIADPMAILDRDLRIIHTNEAFGAAPNAEGSDAQAGPCYEVIRGREVPCDKCSVVEAFRTGQPATRVRRSPCSGNSGWAEVRALPVDGATKDTARHVMLLERDVTHYERRDHEKRRRIGELLHISRADALTGVLNRRATMAYLEEELIRAKEQGTHLSVLFCDLNDFKLVNDRYGHSVGDEVLHAVARVLSAGVRTADAVGRIGGDEFLVILPGTPAESAQTLAARTTERLAKTVVEAPSGEAVAISLSIGAASLEGDDLEAQALVRIADEAMYAAKQERQSGLPKG